MNEEVEKEVVFGPEEDAVYQALDMKRPSLITVFQRPSNRLTGERSIARVAEVTAANQFILRSDDEYFAESVKGMERAIKRKQWKIVRVGKDKFGQLPDSLREENESPKEKTRRLQLELRENSEIVTKVKEANESLTDQMAELTEKLASALSDDNSDKSKIAELQKSLKDAQTTISALQKAKKDK